MPKSMTGYGHAEKHTETRKFSVEIKSVNNRYADINIRMPRKYIFLESRLRSVLKEYVERGKIDVFINTEEYGEAAGSLQYNEVLAGEYIAAMRTMIEKYGLSQEIRAEDVARAPEVFSIEEAELDEDELCSYLESTLREAAEHFNESRSAEGARLKEDLLKKLEELLAITEDVIAHEPEIMQAYKERLTQKLNEILEDKGIEESRIAAECVIYADKISTDEETVRLKSHIDSMKKELEKGSDIGRKLDFIAQEMNREANTILSKANDLETSNIAIDLKTGIEKIREQVQNIE